MNIVNDEDNVTLYGVTINEDATQTFDALQISEKTWDESINEVNRVLRLDSCKTMINLYALCLQSKKLNKLLNLSKPQGVFILGFFCGIYCERAARNKADGRISQKSNKGWSFWQ